MKKGIYLVLILCFTMILSGCGGNKDQQITSSTNVESTNKESISHVDLADLSSLSTVDKLEEYISTDVENTLNKMSEDQEKLISEVNSYEKYVDNVSKVETYYNEIIEETNQLGIRLREYSLKYAQIILDTQSGYDEKYDELDGIYDCIYKDAGKDMYDIYDVILKDMYKAYYDGIIKDGYDLVPYREWSDVHSDEYDLWSDTRSEVYSIWSDARSDIYDFCTDVRGEVYDRDEKRIEKIINKFTEDIIDLKTDK